jgi:hypothetical protein
VIEFVGIRYVDYRETILMVTAYVVVTVLAAGANIFAATNDFIRAEWVLANMTKLGLPHVLMGRPNHYRGPKGTMQDDVPLKA